MILVTGATGLLGSHLLIQLAEQGETCRALYRNKAKINDVHGLFVFTFVKRQKKNGFPLNGFKAIY